MKRCLLLVALGLAGCSHAPVCPEPDVSQFHHPAFAWRRVARLVILPLVNETHHPQAAEEFRRSLHAELQQLALFEAVPAPAELTERTARCVRDSGRFSEAEMVALARCGGADVILVGTLSHYSPYQRPRVGLTLQAISPDLGQVVASVDGLWDATDHAVADRARLYQRPRTHKEALCDHLLGRWDDAYGSDLVLQSPHLFQRFVAFEAARLLVGEPASRPTPAKECGAGLWDFPLSVQAWVTSWFAKPPCPPQPPANGETKPADNKNSGGETSPKPRPAEGKKEDKKAAKPEENKPVLPPPTEAK